MQILVSKIYTLLAQKGMTMSELSGQAGVSRQSLSAIMWRKTCQPKTAAKLATGLGINVEEIIAQEERP